MTSSAFKLTSSYKRSTEDTNFKACIYTNATASHCYFNCVLFAKKLCFNVIWPPIDSTMSAMFPETLALIDGFFHGQEMEKLIL